MDDEAETYKMWRVRSVHHISGINLFAGFLPFPVPSMLPLYPSSRFLLPRIPSLIFCYLLSYTGYINYNRTS